MGLHIPPTIAALIGLPPPIALVGTLGFVFFLFWRDIRQRPNVTGAIWLPVIWVVLMGSRSVAQWLYILRFPRSRLTGRRKSPGRSSVHHY